eukprot:Colp12_sorted_trinity150504_noHs@25898
MKGFASLLLACVLIGVAAGAAQCPNPLLNSFTSGKYFGVKSEATLTSPVTVNVSFPCPITQSCISNEKMTVIANFWNDIKNDFQYEFNNISAGVAELVKMSEDINPLVNELAKTIRDAGIKVDLTQVQVAISAAISTAKNYLAKTFNSVSNCATKALQFEAGNLCLMVNADWQSYITVDSQTGDITVTYNKGNCDGLVGACLPIFTDLNDFMVAFVNSYANVFTSIVNLLDQITNGNPVAILAVSGVKATLNSGVNTIKAIVNSIPKICDGNTCTNFICDSFVGVKKGLGDDPFKTSFGSLKNNFGNNPLSGFKLGDLGSSTTTNNNLGGLTSGLTNLLGGATTMSTATSSGLFKLRDIDEQYEEIHNRLRSVIDIVENHVVKSSAITRSRRATTSTFSATGGYDAVATGSQSKLSTTVTLSGFNSASSVAASFVAVTAGVIAALLL